jgi:hypothetical protein
MRWCSFCLKPRPRVVHDFVPSTLVVVVSRARGSTPQHQAALPAAGFAVTRRPRCRLSGGGVAGLAKATGKHEVRGIGGRQGLPTDVDLTATDSATSWLPQRHVTGESCRPEPWLGFWNPALQQRSPHTGRARDLPRHKGARRVVRPTR